MESKLFATDIVKKLVAAGHVAYFAGGWVRDYLMGHPSKDIDIATDAPPEKILDLFPRTILVGLAFGVVVVLVDGKQFEVSTFRKDFQYKDGRRPESIEFSTPEEDAKRRDFTINGMFYDPINEVIHDFVGGSEDISRGVVRSIGNPHERFVEDRLRMIRAIRFAARFGFTIDQDTQDAISENAETLFPAVAIERVWQEFNKMAVNPRFDQAIAEMYRLGLLAVIFPVLQKVGLHDIRERVLNFHLFPEETPTILYLLQLFPGFSLEKVTEIFNALRVSKKDIKLVELFKVAEEMVEKEEKSHVIDTHDWVYFYAHPDAELILKVLALRYPEEQRHVFQNRHEIRKNELQRHIQRVALGKPLVTAALLQAHGVSPGKPMGKLLKEAEKMVINHNRENADEIVEMLKKSAHWPN